MIDCTLGLSFCFFNVLTIKCDTSVPSVLCCLPHACYAGDCVTLHSTQYISMYPLHIIKHIQKLECLKEQEKININRSSNICS